MLSGVGKNMPNLQKRGLATCHRTGKRQYLISSIPCLRRILICGTRAYDSMKSARPLRRTTGDFARQLAGTSFGRGGTLYRLIGGWRWTKSSLNSAILMRGETAFLREKKAP